MLISSFKYLKLKKSIIANYIYKKLLLSFVDLLIFSIWLKKLTEPLSLTVGREIVNIIIFLEI